MTGIDISKAYWEEYGKKMIEENFSEYKDRIAVGLVGHGSECFGFDDEISHDHDFDAGFSIWLTDEDEQLFGFKLFRAYSKLPREFMGVKLQKVSLFGNESKGVHKISDFYSQYTGKNGSPETWQEWLYTPSFYFAEATNGEVFCDPLGEFTRIRNEILHGMPEDVRLKKIASKCLVMAQTGQYNFERCLAHSEKASSQIALSKFCEHTAELIFLLNKCHAPYYKWLFRGMKKLDILGDREQILNELLCSRTLEDVNKIDLIENLCSDIIRELKKQFSIETKGNYLEPYAYAINDKIKNSEIRNLHIIQE